MVEADGAEDVAGATTEVGGAVAWAEVEVGAAQTVAGLVLRQNSKLSAVGGMVTEPGGRRLLNLSPGGQ